MKTALKKILDSFCRPEERDFKLTASRRMTRHGMGCYNANTKRICIYILRQKDDWALIATALHELAHHLDITRHRRLYLKRRKQRRRYPWHGRGFKQTIASLIAAFNVRYVDYGRMVYRPNKPRVVPRFVPKNQIPNSGGINSERRLQDHAGGIQSEASAIR